jgi:hypothetical protein
MGSAAWLRLQVAGLQTAENIRFAPDLQVGQSELRYSRWT